jgi:two-component system chemotaxis sensor kinase CheA
MAERTLGRYRKNPAAPGLPPAPKPAPAPSPIAPAPSVPLVPVENSIVAETELNLNLADDADLLREFITESREHLDHIEHGVLVLEHQPADTETLNTVFRAFHTFKGGAGFLNLIPINRLAHALESLLELARQGRLTINAPVIELILRGRDVLKQFLDEIEGQIAGTRPVAPILISTAALKAEVQEQVENSTSKIDAAAAETADHLQSATDNQSRDGQSAMVKVDTTKLDSLLDLVGEMVIAQSLVSQDLGRLAGVNPQSTQNLAQLARITKELQRVSMAMRMVPIRSLFQKMARVTRDLGAKQRKKIQFITSGEDTELDRGVVEELNDPLLHMIRNSADHGIETPEKRVAAGKPAGGHAATPRVSPGWQHRRRNFGRRRRAEPRPHSRKRPSNAAWCRAGRNAHGRGSLSFHLRRRLFHRRESHRPFRARRRPRRRAPQHRTAARPAFPSPRTPRKGTRFTIALPLTLAIIDGLVVKRRRGALHHPDTCLCAGVAPRSSGGDDFARCRTARRS